MIRRHLERTLVESLRRFPVVLLLGGRGVGKSTLVRSLCQGDWPATYLTLEDPALRETVRQDPDNFLANVTEPLVLDEIQRAPDLLPALDRHIGWDLQPGRFVLAASARVLESHAPSFPLAGRMAVHHLSPLSWCEWRGREPFPILDRLFQSEFAWDLMAALPDPVSEDRHHEIQSFLLCGGLPAPASMDSWIARREWFASHLERLLKGERSQLPIELTKLMKAFAARTSQILNLSDVARDVGLPLSMVRRSLKVLQRIYQLDLLNPSVAVGGKHPFKKPKLYLPDTGLSCHLESIQEWRDLERRSRVDAMVRTWVCGELHKLLDHTFLPTGLRYWRVHPDREVDFVVERGDEIVGIQVNWTGSFTRREIRGLAKCRQSAGRRWHLGVLLHGGTETYIVDESVACVPFGTFFGREDPIPTPSEA